MIKVFLIFAVVAVTGCGVKGKPQPPLTPAQLSRGSPSFNKATENIKVPRNKKIDGDFEEPVDFEPEKDER